MAPDFSASSKGRNLIRPFASRNSTAALKREHGPQLASYARRKAGFEPTIAFSCFDFSLEVAISLSGVASMPSIG